MWAAFIVGFVRTTVENSTGSESWTNVAFGFIFATETSFGTVCRLV